MAGQLGVRWYHVADGIYDRGKSRTNRREAETVIATITERLTSKDTQDLSIGIVTLSAAQQELIEDLLEQARRDHPEMDHYFGNDVVEPVFVKNLENVQGDERDVIMLSICYGPDASGRPPSMNFGPLNRDGGERRLNVAITRARQELHVFSTLKAEHIDLRRTRATGARDLKTFLDYAERGPKALAEAVVVDGGAECESPLEIEIHNALVREGYVVDKQVGCSGYRVDLAVVDPERPGRYLLGIECDGASYHRAHTARDRDRLREAVLTDLGWRIHRVWSTDWWRRPEREVEKIKTAVEQARGSGTPPRPAAANESGGQATQPVQSEPTGAEQFASRTEATATPDWRQEAKEHHPYVLADTSTRLGTPETLRHAPNNDFIANATKYVVDTEGPVSVNVALRRVAAYWDCNRIAGKIRENLLAGLTSAPVTWSMSGGAEFLWPEGQTPQDYRDFRVPTADPATHRAIDDICLEEIANAAHKVLQQQYGLPAADLARESARLFGLKRVAKKAQERILKAIQMLIDRGVAG